MNSNTTGGTIRLPPSLPLVATTEFQNTANGSGSLASNTIAGQNTGVAFEALLRNAAGSASTALGKYPLSANVTGHNNTATDLLR